MTYNINTYNKEYYLAHKKELNNKRKINRQKQRKTSVKLVTDNLEKFILNAF
jgi:hypothetical protein